MVLGVLFIAQW